MGKQIRINDSIGTVEFPDTMSDEEIVKAIRFDILKESPEVGDAVQSESPTTVSGQTRTKLPPRKEEEFQAWYKDAAMRTGLSDNPDDPLHKYDYRGAFLAGDYPQINPTDNQYHWSSKYKDDDHPNRFVNGVDTKLDEAPQFISAHSQSKPLEHVKSDWSKPSEFSKEPIPSTVKDQLNKPISSYTQNKLITDANLNSLADEYEKLAPGLGNVVRNGGAPSQVTKTPDGKVQLVYGVDVRNRQQFTMPEVDIVADRLPENPKMDTIVPSVNKLSERIGGNVELKKYDESVKLFNQTFPEFENDLKKFEEFSKSYDGQFAKLEKEIAEKQKNGEDTNNLVLEYNGLIEESRNKIHEKFPNLQKALAENRLLVESAKSNPALQDGFNDVADYQRLIKKYDEEKDSVPPEIAKKIKEARDQRIQSWSWDVIESQTSAKENDAEFERRRKNLLKIADLPQRSMNDIAIGASGVVTGIAGAGEWMGSEKSKEFGDKVHEWSESIAPDDPNGFDEFLQGLGSQVIFLPFGYGVGTVGTMMNLFSPKLAVAFGAGSAAVFESAVEAGNVYREIMLNGGTKEQAEAGATKTFGVNIPLVYFSDKFILGGIKGDFALQHALSSTVVNAFQEAGQEVTSNYATGRPLMKNVPSSAFFGGIIGGGMFLALPSMEDVQFAEPIPRARELSEIAQQVDLYFEDKSPSPVDVTKPIGVDEFGIPFNRTISTQKKREPIVVPSTVSERITDPIKLREEAITILSAQLTKEEATRVVVNLTAKQVDDLVNARPEGYEAASRIMNGFQSVQDKKAQKFVEEQAMRDEAEKFGVEFAGFTKHGDKSYSEYNDPVTGGNFTVNEGETLGDAILRVRTRFEEGAKWRAAQKLKEQPKFEVKVEQIPLVVEPVVAPVEEKKPEPKVESKPEVKAEKPKSQPKPANVSQIEEAPLSDLKTDEVRFQNREKLDEERVAYMVENFDRKKVEEDPIRYWIDPKTKEKFILSGHHRLAVFQKKGEENIPAREFKGTEEEAKEFALNSNNQSAPETLIARAKLYRAERKKGTPEKEIKKLATREFANKKVVYALSALNPNGKAITNLASLQKVTGKNFDIAKNIATMIGDMRIIYSELTDSHENEIYDYLVKNYDKFKSDSDFQMAVERQMSRITLMGKFEADKPLNFGDNSAISQAEKDFTAEWQKELNELEELFKATQVRLDKRRQYHLEKGATPEEARVKSQDVADEVLAVQSRIVKHKQKFKDEIGKLRNQEQSLFDGVSDEQIRNIEQRPADEAEEFEPVLKAVESKAEALESKEQIAKSPEERNDVKNEVNEVLAEVEEDVEELKKPLREFDLRNDTKPAHPFLEDLYAVIYLDNQAVEKELSRKDINAIIETYANERLAGQDVTRKNLRQEIMKALSGTDDVIKREAGMTRLTPLIQKYFESVKPSQEFIDDVKNKKKAEEERKAGLGKYEAIIDDIFTDFKKRKGRQESAPVSMKGKEVVFAYNPNSDTYEATVTGNGFTKHIKTPNIERLFREVRTELDKEYSSPKSPNEAEKSIEDNENEINNILGEAPKRKPRELDKDVLYQEEETKPSYDNEIRYQKIKYYFTQIFKELGRNIQAFKERIAKTFGNRVDNFVKRFLDENGIEERPSVQYVNAAKLPIPPEYVTAKDFNNAIDEHQLYAVNLMIHNSKQGNKAFLLADGTGFGKTRIELAFADWMFKQTGRPAMLVTQNKSIIENSIKREAGAIGVGQVVHQEEIFDKKGNRIVSMNKDHIEVVTYDDIRTGKYKKDMQYSVVIFDEAQNLKNADAQRSIISDSIKSDHHVYATATPMDNPHNAEYFLSKITGIPEHEIRKSMGYKVIIGQDQWGNATRKIEYEQGKSYGSVQRSLLKMRDSAIENGAMVRREYPFYGMVQPMYLTLDQFQLAEQEAINSGYGNHPKARMAAVGEMSRWVEPLKVNRVFDMVLDDLKQGKQVIIVAEGVSDTDLKKLGTTVRGAITMFAEKLEAAGIPFAKIYGGGKLIGDIDKFQSGEVKVALMTPKSGGAGVNLDDAQGKAPRKMYVITTNYAGDVFEQVLGRGSRRNTKSPFDVRVVSFTNSITDNNRQNILRRKLQTMRSIQSGVDPDQAQMDESEAKIGGIIKTGGEVLYQEENDSFETLYHYSDKEISKFKGVSIGTWFTDNEVGYARRSNAKFRNTIRINISKLNLANKKQATEAGLYRGNELEYVKKLKSLGFDGIKMTVDGDVHYQIFDVKNIESSGQVLFQEEKSGESVSMDEILPPAKNKREEVERAVYAQLSEDKAKAAMFVLDAGASAAVQNGQANSIADYYERVLSKVTRMNFDPNMVFGELLQQAFNEGFFAVHSVNTEGLDQILKDNGISSPSVNVVSSPDVLGGFGNEIQLLFERDTLEKKTDKTAGIEEIKGVIVSPSKFEQVKQKSIGTILEGKIYSGAGIGEKIKAIRDILKRSPRIMFQQDLSSEMEEQYIREQEAKGNLSIREKIKEEKAQKELGIRKDELARTRQAKENQFNSLVRQESQFKREISLARSKNDSTGVKKGLVALKAVQVQMNRLYKELGKSTDNMFDDNQTLFQIPGEKKIVKGATDVSDFARTGKVALYIFENADFSTIVHEFMHIWRRTGVFNEAQIETLNQWVGSQDWSNWSRQQEEKLARGFERYLYNGEAPTQGLRSIFQQMKKWMQEIYVLIQKGDPLDINLPVEVRRVFDAIFDENQNTTKIFQRIKEHNEAKRKARQRMNALKAQNELLYRMYATPEMKPLLDKRKQLMDRMYNANPYEANDIEEELVPLNARIDEMSEKLSIVKSLVKQHHQMDKKGNFFDPFISRFALMTKKLGKAGGELIQMAFAGDLVRSKLSDIARPHLHEIAKIYDKYKDKKLEQSFKQKDISRAVVNAIENERNKSWKIGDEVPTEIKLSTPEMTEDAKKVFQETKALLDEFRDILTALGYKTRDAYFSHIMAMDILDQQLSVEMQKRTETDEDGNAREIKLEKDINAESRHLKPREDAMIDYDTNLPRVLASYVGSVTRKLSYDQFVNYIKKELAKDISPFLKKGRNVEQLIDIAREYATQVMHPLNGSGKVYDALKYLRRNQYQAFLAYNVKASLDNSLQVYLARLYVTNEADKLENKLWNSFSRTYNGIDGNLQVAMNLSRNAMQNYLELTLAETDRSGRFREFFEKHDIFKSAETKNWQRAEMLGIIDSAMKNPRYKSLLDKNNGDEIAAINEVLEDDIAFDKAVSNATYVSVESQVGVTPSVRPTAFDIPWLRMTVLMLRSFRFRQLELLVRSFKTLRNKDEGMRESALRSIFARGITPDAEPAEALQYFADYKKSFRGLLDQMKREGLSDRDGLSLKFMEDYFEHIVKQESELAEIVKKLEPGTETRRRMTKVWAQYYTLLTINSFSSRMFWYFVSPFIFGALLPDDKDKEKKTMEKAFDEAYIRVLLDLSPLPAYGGNPKNLTASPVFPDIGVLERAVRYGTFSGRETAKDVVNYSMNSFIPYLGAVNRGLDYRLSSNLVDAIAPKKTGGNLTPKEKLAKQLQAQKDAIGKLKPNN